MDDSRKQSNKPNISVITTRLVDLILKMSAKERQTLLMYRKSIEKDRGKRLVMDHETRLWIGRTYAETLEEIHREMKKAGRGFKGEDFLIDKDEKNDVTIRIRYLDEIRVFGKTLKELDFALEASASDVEKYF